MDKKQQFTVASLQSADSSVLLRLILQGRLKGLLNAAQVVDFLYSCFIEVREENRK